MESGVKSKRPFGITILMIWFVMEGVYYFYTNSIVTEEQYEGKITNIYPDLDATRNIQSSILGEVVIMP